MIIGAHRRTPLDKRPVESFPDPVVKLINRFDVAAMTGLDLYCLLEQAKRDPSQKRSIAKKLMNFQGIMPPLDWRKFNAEG